MVLGGETSPGLGPIYIVQEGYIPVICVIYPVRLIFSPGSEV